jgi:hypothetical protein
LGGRSNVLVGANTGGGSVQFRTNAICIGAGTQPLGNNTAVIGLGLSTCKVDAAVLTVAGGAQVMTNTFVDQVDRYYSIPNAWTNFIWSPSEAHTVTQLTALAWVPGVCTATVGVSTYWSNAVTGWAVATNIRISSTGSVANCSVTVPANGGLWITYGPGFASTSNGMVQIRMRKR